MVNANIHTRIKFLLLLSPNFPYCKITATGRPRGASSTVEFSSQHPAPRVSVLATLCSVHYALWPALLHSVKTGPWIHTAQHPAGISGDMLPRSRSDRQPPSRLWSCTSTPLPHTSPWRAVQLSWASFPLPTISEQFLQAGK